MPQPQTLSNFSDDFVESGLYPGGSGTITDIRYTLWDYDGKRPPDSQCAVKLTMQPTDGSNEGKPVEVYWSVGPSADFQPDHTGGFVLSETRAQISKSSNWFIVGSRLKDTCGIESKDVNTPGKGLLNLIGGDITLTRIDQPKRDMKDDPEEGGNKKGPRTILVPTRFKGVWEKGGKPRPVAAAARPAAAAPAHAPASAPAPAASNGAGSFDVYAALKDIVTDAGGSIDTSLIGRAMLDKIAAAGESVETRKAAVTALSKANIEETSMLAQLQLDGTTLSL
jgi:hypothetical protein